MEDPILIGVGSTEAQMLAVDVLAYTLQKWTQRSIEVVPLFRCGVPIPTPRDARNISRTPFSYQRFLLPELGKFKRRTIYLDSDMIVFKDIGELYDTEMEEFDVLACQATPGRKDRIVYSVLLIGAHCPWKIDGIIQKLDSGEFSYEDLMFKFKVPGRVDICLPYHWNSCEHYEPGNTALLHYTDMWLQPWLVTTNPLASLWIKELLGAIEAGVVATSAVAEGVKKRWVRPSLLYQAENGIPDPKDIPWLVRLRDIPFTRYCRRKKFRIF